MNPSSQIVPRLNNNDDSATLISIIVDQGDYVTKGQVICTLETSKVALEIVAEFDGFVFFLKKTDEECIVGENLCVFSQQQDFDVYPYKKDVNVGKPISKSAMNLMNRYGIVYEEMPQTGVITETMVEEYYASCTSQKTNFDVHENSLVIYCGGSHAEVVYEAVLSANELDVFGFVD